MAIQFACPSCQRAIEIDDEWANSDVACPFCKAVVTAPARSTWSATPEAQPVELVDTPPPPPGVNIYGRWSLIMAISAIAIACVIFVIVLGKVGPQLVELAEQGASQREVQDAMLEMAEDDASLAMVLGLSSILLTLTSLAGTILGIIGLTRPNLRRGTATAGLIISALFLLCQCPGFATAFT